MKHLILLVAACTACLSCKAEAVVERSADWRDSTETQRAKVHHADEHATLVDLSFFRDGGFAALTQFSITDKMPIDAFYVYRNGSLAGLMKPGLAIREEKDVESGPIPGHAVLLVGSGRAAGLRAVLWTSYTSHNAYLFAFVGDHSLELESPIVRSYFSRVRFSADVHVSAKAPFLSASEVWTIANRRGEIVFGFLFFGLPIAAVYLLRRIRRARIKRPNQSPEPTAMSVTPPAAQEPRQP